MILLAKPDRLRKFNFRQAMRINNFYSDSEDYTKTSDRRLMLISKLVITKKRPAIVIELISGFKPFTYKISMSEAKRVTKEYDSNQH